MQSAETSRDSMSLKDFLATVREVLSNVYADTYWIRAEISELRENANGNCYLVLVDKGNADKLIEAKVNAVIWKSSYTLIKSFFFSETQRNLCPGMKVLVAVSLSFHEQYGLQLNIRNIDPSFTIGDIAKKRQETIHRLKEDGVWDMNRQTELPVPCRRIAVISSDTAAGYGDFRDQLMADNNRFGFVPTLFPAVMQGDQTVQSIIDALDKIYEQINHFDVVVIIRGGGATTDMAAFDEYDLACNVANFPLPVITGIGHDRDESVVDMVAAIRCKTPTAVAAFLVEKMMELETELLSIQQDITHAFRKRLSDETHEVERLSHSLSSVCRLTLQSAAQWVDMCGIRLTTAIRTLLREESHRLEMLEKSLTLVSPETILGKGYSLTVSKGKVVSSVKDLQPGDQLTTYLKDGNIQSVINKCEKNEEGNVL
ncbi:MAG: exodeoxyribonuclease VII large subunit [Paludibacteraceae bacterium]|nr:exodeoxyribonuclease VII large subunit [Paludibacteraceae bacterium]